MKLTVAFVFSVAFAVATAATVSKGEDIQEKATSDLNKSTSVTTNGDPQVLQLVAKLGNETIKICKAVPVSKDPLLKIEWILTAAECLPEYDLGNRVKYFATHLSKNNDSKLEVEVSAYWHHANYPEYDNKTKAHNIGIFLSVMPQMRAIDANNAYDDKGKDYNGTIGEIFQWKTVGGENEYKKTLTKVEIVDSVRCKNLYPSYSGNEYLCASGWFRNGLGPEDVGTPLVVYENGQPLVLGIAVNVRPLAPYASHLMQFLSLRPYKNWIEYKVIA